MASKPFELHDYLRQNLPVWQAHLRAVNDGIRRRVSNGADSVSTPELLTHTGPSVVASSLDSASSTAWNPQPPQPEPKSLLPSPDAGLKRKSPSLADSRPGKKHRTIPSPVPTLVYYDAEAQLRLSNIVQDLVKAKGLLRQGENTVQICQIKEKLSEASDLCEDAAYQVLRDGNCLEYTTKALAIFQDILSTSYHEDPACDMRFSAQENPSDSQCAKMQWKTKILAAEDYGDDIDDNSEDDLELAPIRLTSRLPAR